MSSESSPPQEMFSDFVQIGVVVDDLHRTLEVLSKVFGMGFFRVITTPVDGRPTGRDIYRGQPANFVAHKAFAQLGAIELELIQPLEGESIWADFLREHGEGIHHIRFNVPSVEPVIEYLARHGIDPIQSGPGLRPGTTWINFDTDHRVGFNIEIMNVAPESDGKTPEIVDGKVKE
jgi:hypothetical protein